MFALHVDITEIHLISKSGYLLLDLPPPVLDLGHLGRDPVRRVRDRVRDEELDRQQNVLQKEIIFFKRRVPINNSCCFGRNLYEVRRREG